MILSHDHDLIPEKDKISKILKIFKNFPVKSFRVGVKNRVGRVTVNTHIFLALDADPPIEKGCPNILTLLT